MEKGCVIGNARWAGVQSREEGGRGVPGSAGQPGSGCCRGQEAGTGKGKGCTSTTHTAAPFPVHGAQTPAAIKSDKDGGFFPFGQSALYCIEEGTKKAIDL